MFWTNWPLLSKDAKLKQIECCAQCFDANFKQQDSCAQCFAQGLAFLEKLPISRTKTVSQSVSTPSLSNRTVAHALLGKFKIFNKSRNFQANAYLKHFDSCAVFLTAQSFDVNFEEHDRCARCFRQGLAFLEKSPISRKTTVCQSVVTPISSNRTVAHGFLDKCLLVNKRRQIDSCAESFDANFEQQDCCVFGQVFA